MTRLEGTAREVIEGAAQRGAPEALFELGLMYCSGREVDLDLVLAHKWFNLAALRGNDEAKRYRAEEARELARLIGGAAVGGVGTRANDAHLGRERTRRAHAHNEPADNGAADHALTAPCSPYRRPGSIRKAAIM